MLAGTEYFVLVTIKKADSFFFFCRYLQSYDRWYDAALMAKTYLSEAESSTVMRKWAQYLVSLND